MTKILKKLGLSKDISNTTQMLDALDITLQSVDITNAVRITEMRKANPSEPLVIKTNTKFLCGEGLLLDAMLIFEQVADSTKTDPQDLLFTCKVDNEALVDLEYSSDVSAAFISKHEAPISFIENLCGGVNVWNMHHFNSDDAHIAILKDKTLNTVQSYLLNLINAEQQSLLAKDVLMQVRDKVSEILVLQ